MRFGVDVTTADIVTCFNSGLAETPGYAFQNNKKFESELQTLVNGELTFYDSVNSKKVF